MRASKGRKVSKITDNSTKILISGTSVPSSKDTEKNIDNDDDEDVQELNVTCG